MAVNAVFVAQSNRSLDALLASRAQLARQLARAGAGGQQIVNRTETDGVRAYLVLRNGTTFGTPPPTGAGIQSLTVTLNAPNRVDRAQLTLTVDTALVSGARQRLRRILALVSLVALAVSALLVAGAVRLALRPLDAMAALAKTVTEGNRGLRLAPTRTDTEIGQTARAFDEMLDELEGAETRARQAEERTRAFLADAAHELRTPITGVQAAAETLLHHGDALPAADREHLQALLVREAQRAGTLISDLLAAARLDAGVELHTEPVSLGHLAAGELDRVRLLHPEAQVSTGSGPDVVITADADKVRGILRNVVDNAVRAAGPAGPDPPRPPHRGRVRGAGPLGLRTGRAAERAGAHLRAAGPAGPQPRRRRRRLRPRAGHRPRLRPGPRWRPGLPRPRRPRCPVPADPPLAPPELSA